MSDRIAMEDLNAQQFQAMMLIGLGGAAPQVLLRRCCHPCFFLHPLASLPLGLIQFVSYFFVFSDRVNFGPVLVPGLGPHVFDTLGLNLKWTCLVSSL